MFYVISGAITSFICFALGTYSTVVYGFCYGFMGFVNGLIIGVFSCIPFIIKKVLEHRKKSLRNAE